MAINKHNIFVNGKQVGGPIKNDLLEYKKMYNAILNNEPILSKEEARLKMEEFIKD